MFHSIMVFRQTLKERSSLDGDLKLGAYFSVSDRACLKPPQKTIPQGIPQSSITMMLEEGSLDQSSLLSEMPLTS